MIPLEIHGGQEVYREAGLPQRAVEGRSVRGHSVGSLWACSSGGRGWTNLWTRTRKRERFQQNDECSKWMFRNIQHCAKLARVPIVAAGMGGLCPHIHGQGSHKRQAGPRKGNNVKDKRRCAALTTPEVVSWVSVCLMVLSGLRHNWMVFGSSCCLHIYFQCLCQGHTILHSRE